MHAVYKKYIYLVIIVCFIIVFDQATKLVALNGLQLHQSVPMLPFLNFTLVYNSGGAFGILGGASQGVRILVFLGFAVVAVLVIWGLYIKYADKSKLAAFSLSLVLGGATGNLIDRVNYGFVIDFIDVYVGNWHWPAFNIADIGVTMGLIFFIIFVLFEKK